MSLQNKTKKQHLQKLLSLTITTLNTMNSLLPLALPYASMSQEVRHYTNYIQLQTVGAKILEQAIQTTDTLCFRTAEAFTPVVINGTVQDESIANGIQDVFQNGITSNNIISSGGSQNVSSGGTALFTVIVSGGSQDIKNGGTALDTTVSLGGWQDISSGGTALSTTVSAGGGQFIFDGGTAISTTVSSGGGQHLSNGGTVFATKIISTGSQAITNGGTALDTIVDSSGWQRIYLTGTALSTSVMNNGKQVVENGGIAISTTLSDSGTQIINSGGKALSTTLNNSGWQNIYQNGLASSTTVNDGGEQYISQGGIADSTTLNSGGLQLVYQGGIALSTTVSSGGRQYIYQGGTALVIKQLAKAAIQVTVSAGDGTLVNGTNTLGNFSLSNGVASNFVLENGGKQNIHQGGTALDTTLSSSGVQNISIGGTGSFTTVNSGGSQTIYQGGTALYTTVSVGGTAMVTAGGKDISATISIGGTQIVDGGTTDNATVAGGIQIVYIGGTTSNTIINSAGQKVVSTGGTALYTTISSGGYMSLNTGAQALGNTTNNGGILDLVNYDQTTINLLGTNGTVLLNIPNLGTPFSTGRNLILSSLEGSQTFVINSDLANNTSDKITVTGTATGTHHIQIGREATIGSAYNNITEDHRTQVASVNSGDVTFDGALSTIDGVNIMPRILQEGNEWYLVGAKLLGPSKLALTSQAAGNMLYTSLRATNDNLQRRLGELWYNNNNGIWLRTYGGEYSVDSSSLKHFTIQGGYDWVHPTANGKIVTGITIDNQSGSTGYKYGSGKLTNMRMGMYHAWLGNSGHYYDIVAKTGRLSNKFTVYDNAAINAEYKVWNTTLSAEYGYTKQLKQGYYIKPQAKLTYSRINGANYTADNGTAVSQSGINSLTAILGASIGRSLERVNYYLTASVLHELTANNKVATGKDAYASTIEQDLTGTSIELTLGGNVKMGKDSNLYLDASRSFGGKVINKWQLQAGYRYKF